MSEKETPGAVAGRAATVQPGTKNGPEKRKDDFKEASPGAAEDREAAKDRGG